MTNNRIWIELTLPKYNDPERETIAKKQAALATNMIRRLGSDGSEFFWNEHKSCYCLADSSGTYVELSDKGHWFNLDFFGRE